MSKLTYPELDAIHEHPIQPLGLDIQGTLRFKRNKIVVDLLNRATANGFGLNEISLAGHSNADYEQLMQFIGYSHSGFVELSTTRNVTVERVERKLRKQRKRPQ